MRQVIRRFLKHLDAEKNASASTIETYRYDLIKFDDYLAHRLGIRFLPGDVSREHMRDYLMWLGEVGHQKPNGPSARARALAAIRSFFSPSLPPHLKFTHRYIHQRRDIEFDKDSLVDGYCKRFEVFVVEPASG